LLSASVLERRLYSPQSVRPSLVLLARHGMHVVRVRHTPAGIEYLIAFDSLEARARGWDRFNTDPDWCQLLATGVVELREIVIARAA